MSDELATIEAADELEIASLGRDRTLRDPVTIWVVRLGDDLYVRSVNGRNGAWFRGTQVHHEGRIRAGGVEKDVTFVDADRDVEDQIDNGYRTKYRRYGPSIVGSVVTPEARSATIKPDPIGSEGVPVLQPQRHRQARRAGVRQPAQGAHRRP